MPRAVPEWIAKHDDQAVPPRVRLRVRERDNNHCRNCGRDLAADKAECDHVVSLINGGENSESNLQTLCLPCHAHKTVADVHVKARTASRRKRHWGIRRKRSSFPTNKDGKFKKKMSGEVVRR